MRVLKKSGLSRNPRNLPGPLNFSVPLTTNVPNAFFDRSQISLARHVWHFSTTAALPFAPWVALPETHAHYQCVSSNESSTSLGRSKFLKGLHLLSRKRDLNRNFVHSFFCRLVSWITLFSGILAWVPHCYSWLIKNIWSGSLSTTCPTWCKSRDYQQSCPAQLQLRWKIWRTVYTKQAPQK